MANVFLVSPETNKSYPWEQRQGYYGNNVLVDASVCSPTYCSEGKRLNCYLPLQTAVRFLIHPTRLRQSYHLHQLRYLINGI